MKYDIYIKHSDGVKRLGCCNIVHVDEKFIWCFDEEYKPASFIINIDLFAYLKPPPVQPNTQE